MLPFPPWIAYTLQKQMNASVVIGIAVVCLATATGIGAWVLSCVSNTDEDRIRSGINRKHPDLEVVSVIYIPRSEDGTRLGNVSDTHGRCYCVEAKMGQDDVVLEARVMGWAGVVIEGIGKPKKNR